MALDVQTFRTRGLTAIVFVIVMLTGMFWNETSFFILFSFIHFGCWYEYQPLIGKIDPGYKKISVIHRYGIMLAGWCMMWYFAPASWQVNGTRLNEIALFTGAGLALLVLLSVLFFEKPLRLQNFGHSFFGLCYISLSMALLVDLSHFYSRLPGGENLQIHGAFKFYPVIIPAAIIFSIWVNDTMAYIVGSLIGKTPLSKVSPKKTWEGTIGGAILCVVVIGLIFSNLDTDIVWPGYHFHFGKIYWYILAALAAIAGTFGDLLESKLKRMAGVKDTGHIMPGHGGFLDRFDSLLLAATIVWMYCEAWF